MSTPALIQQAPYSQEAEEAVLGAVMINPESFLAVASFLTADDFFILRHGYIWEAMTRIVERNDRLDTLTVQEELRAHGRLNDIGGPAYLMQLINNTPTSVHAEVYGRLVERAALRRRLLTAADEIKSLAMDETLTTENVTSEAESRLFRVTERNLRRDIIPMREAIIDYYTKVEHLMQHQDEPLGLPTGFRDLNELLGGLQRSDLLIFAGRPGMGKTSFLLSVALNAANIGARIAIFSMEMGADQIVQRFISMDTGINTQKLRLGQLTPEEWRRFVQSSGRLGNLRIWIDDSPALTPLQLRTKCRRLAHEFGLDLVILDYIQLMNAGSGYENNRVQEISYISRNLKEIARELNVPLFTAAQLSRAVEQRQDKRPQLSDLRESGCLAGETLIYLPDQGVSVPIASLVGQAGFNVLALNMQTWKLEAAAVSNAFCTGVKPVYKMKTRLGRTIRATGNHPFLTVCGWKRLDELTTDDHIAVPRTLPSPATQTMTDAELKQTISRAARLAEVVKSQEIDNLAHSDIYWDGIVSIEPDGEAEVFDLTVPSHSNFTADNIICHNSLEQDADIVMFLYRDVVYNEATEFPNRADIIVAKHRNGPTGIVSLHFEKSLTKFSDARTSTIDLSNL
jgi:replicative DNA helicase